MGALPDRQTIINSNLRRYIEPMQKRPSYNDPKINPKRTKEHEMKRCSLIYDLMKEGCTTLCEAKLLNGKMPDILIVDSPEPIVYEILHSEKDKNLEYKREAYLGLKVIGVRT